MAEFVRCVRDGQQPEVGGRQALEVVEVVEAAILSADERRVVDLVEVRA